jgi:hypothetical protein
MDVRAAKEIVIDHLTRLRYDGWQDAQARILPADYEMASIQMVYQRHENARYRLSIRPQAPPLRALKKT